MGRIYLLADRNHAGPPAMIKRSPLPRRSRRHGHSSERGAERTTNDSNMALTDRPLPHLMTSTLSANWPILLVSVVTWLCIVFCLDPAGSYPQLPEGPGLTVDEVFNVEQGVLLVEQTRNLGWLNLLPGASQEAYKVENGYLPDHPPLGRLWLGFHHHLAWFLWPPTDAEGFFVTACARTGSATAFALTVLLVGGFASSWWGSWPGIATSLALVMMPRLFGHAHLASLETITNLTCTAAVLAIANSWSGAAPPRMRSTVFVGLLMGLALLTKVQAILIPIPVIVWTFWHWRHRAWRPLFIWIFTACVIFFAGWPYLWSDPIQNVQEYLGRTTNRAAISVWYLGQKYADKQVPWHYPFVMFALTVPIVLHTFGLIGLYCRSTSRLPHAGPKSAQESVTEAKTNEFHHTSISRDLLLIGCSLFPLVLFALPNIAVYDGERLFLTSFPLWSLFVGRGACEVFNRFAVLTKSTWAAVTIISLMIAPVVWSLISISPYHLCYYNSMFQWNPDLIEKAGLEIDYWGVSMTRSLLERVVQVVPEGADVVLIPTLHQFQADDLRQQSPILRRHRVRIVGYTDDNRSSEYVIVYRRLADLPPHIADKVPDLGTINTNQIGPLRLAYIGQRRR